MSRLLSILFLAVSIHASPLLEKAASTVENRSLRIELEWTHTPAPGTGGATHSRGVLRLAPGNKFVFRSQALTLVSDGTTLWQYMPAAKQVLIQKLSALDPANLPIGLLRGALKAREISSRRESIGGISATRLELKSDRPPLSRYASVTLWLRPNHEPMELQVRDEQGGGIEWKLLRMQDFEPDAHTFTFKIPAGMSVVDTRK